MLWRCNLKYYYQQYNTIHGEYTHIVEEKFIARSFSYIKRSALILDISGGGGRFSLPLKSQGFRTVTSDINFKSLSYIRNKNHESGAILVAPGSQNLPFNEEAFDAALCIQAPALVENDKHFFSNVRCFLRPGGILVVTMTNRLSYKYLFHLLRWKINRKVSRTYGFKVSHILRRATDSGFTILSIQGYNWIPFKKESNSSLIPCFNKTEEISGLRKLPLISPWIIACFVKGNGKCDGYNNGP